MRDLRELREECVKLRDRYFEFTPREPELCRTLEDVSRSERGSVEAAKLVRDFYEDVFAAKYSDGSGEVFDCANNIFEGLAFMAEKALRKRNYFAMDVLLVPSDPNEKDPVSMLIEKIDEALEGEI